MTIPQALELALSRHRAGRLADAETLYRQILAVQPGHADALHLLGVTAYQVGRHDLAETLIRQAIAVTAPGLRYHLDLGNVLSAQRRLDEAIAAYRLFLQFQPDFADAHNNLGATLKSMNRLEEAIASYREALRLNPDLPQAHNNLGIALRERGEIDGAIAAYRRALELQPGYPEALNNLGVALKDRGELDEAIASFRSAIQHSHGNPAMHSNLIFTLHFHPGHDNQTIAAEHQRWNARFSAPLKPLIQPHANDRDPERPLRIGYVSPDFRDNAVGLYLLPLLERHDRARFEILCYSGAAGQDGMTQRFQSLASGWRSTVGVPDARLAEMIREDAVDILVDLALHTAGNRLPVFARQAAPVQVTWLAYPGSAGLPAIGYRFTDARMDPPGGTPAWSAEEPIRLPDCWCCYQPAVASPDVNALPALSGEGVTFGSLNNFAKLHDGVLERWARLLQAVKGSRLLLFCPEGRARERVRAYFGLRGLAADRLEFARFAPRLDYLKLYHRIDIALDPFPFNGMTTTCDALWMGAPVLTLPGAAPASRAGLSLLSSVGLEELVTYSEEDYLQLAVELAGNLPRLAECRATLRARLQASPLMNAPRFAAQIEAAYRSLWRAWSLGPSPIREGERET